MTYFLSFVFVLGILVFVHELGHFIVAKWIGVRVHVFSIGFGPRLFGFRRGDTDYRVSALPLGGYVRMAGDNPTDESTGAQDEFSSRSVPERMAILLAGPLMNLICAVIFFALIYYIGIEQPAYLHEKAVIGWVEPATPADSLGIEIGDEVIAVAGTSVSTWWDVRGAFAPISAGNVNIAFRRENETLARSFKFPDSSSFREGGFWGAYPDWKYKIIAVNDNSPAQQAGLQAGDQFLEINGQPIHIWSTVQSTIESNPENPLEFTMLRDGERILLTVIPQKEESSGLGRIGIASSETSTLVQFGVVESLKKGAQENIDHAGLLFSYLGRVFSGKESGREIGSVITIAFVAGEAARNGWEYMVRLMGMLSLQLGILNLLPIPVLDGGNLMILTIEGISGKPVSIKSRGIAQAVGLVILLGILVFALSNDVSRFILGN
ncbi:MAG: RIP metalloprotease RseP [bacterium]